MFREGPRAFLALPAGSEAEPIRQVVTQMLEQHSVEVFRGVRADPEFAEQIQTALRQADFVVADVTGKSAAVLFEIGLAVGMGKPVLLFSQENTHDLPFDVRALQVAVYKANDLDGVRRYLDLWLSDVLARRQALA